MQQYSAKNSNLTKPDACIIWLHGLGASGHDLMGIMRELQLPKNINIRAVFPDAPLRPITWWDSQTTRAWFDVEKDLSFRDEIGLRASEKIVREILEAQIQSGIASNRIILAGFSQGAALALQTGIRYSSPLGGILVLSGFLPLPETITKEKNSANQNINIMIMHGEKDRIIPWPVAHRSYAALTKENFKPIIKTYDADHTICPEQLPIIRAWLLKIFALTT